MKIGDTVYIKAYEGMLGKVKSIHDDKVCVDMCGTNLEFWVDINDLGIKEDKCNE